MNSNHYLTDLKARDIGENYSVPTRMVEIVAHYMKRYARDCKSKYSKIIREKYEELGETTSNKCKIAHEIVKAVKDQPYDRYGKLVHEAITKLAENDPDKKYLRKVPNKREGIREPNEIKLRELYDKYVIEPCSEIVGMNDAGWYEAYGFVCRYLNGTICSSTSPEYVKVKL